MLDSGTTFYIIGVDEAVRRGYDIVPLQSPVSFSTANGKAWATQLAAFKLPGPTHLGVRLFSRWVPLDCYQFVSSVSMRGSRGLALLASGRC
jgi:hypothetical protein